MVRAPRTWRSPRRVSPSSSLPTDTLLGVLVLAASFGPGYAFERVAERRLPRPSRSALGESIELIVTGAAFSLISALVVLVVAKATSWLDVNKLAGHPSAYVVRHPGPVLEALLLLYALSFTLAAIAASVIYRARSPRIQPGGNPWHHVFLHNRPTEDAAVFVRLDLRDGSSVGGILAAYTLEPGDNREIALVRPLANRGSDTAESSAINEDFVVFREADVAVVRGHYLRPGHQSPA
jgi:hypothetical protein